MDSQSVAKAVAKRRQRRRRESIDALAFLPRIRAIRLGAVRSFDHGRYLSRHRLLVAALSDESERRCSECESSRHQCAFKSRRVCSHATIVRAITRSICRSLFSALLWFCIDLACDHRTMDLLFLRLFSIDRIGLLHCDSDCCCSDFLCTFRIRSTQTTIFALRCKDILLIVYFSHHFHSLRFVCRLVIRMVVQSILTVCMKMAQLF